MSRTNNSVALLLVVLLACCSIVLAQKSYSINSISSAVHVSPGSCDVSVVETYVYDFLGSYSTVARAIPYTIASASGFQSSSLRVEILTSGYTVSKSVSDQQDAKFIVVNMFPSTPAGTSTRIIIRYSYSLTGPIRQSGVSILISQYFNNNYSTIIFVIIIHQLFHQRHHHVE